MNTASPLESQDVGRAEAMNAGSLGKNAAWLFAIQLANQALPLITLPIVTRALGADEFGKMSFVLALMAYAVLISDYGFNLTATASISVHRTDIQRRSRIFWETMAVKSLLAFACAIAMLAALAWFPRLGQDTTLYLIAFGSVLASVLTPNRYYQGVERLPVIGAMTFVTRAAAVPATLWFVRSPADTGVALTITVTSALSGALLSLGYLWVRRDVRYVAPTYAGLRRSLVDGWHVFVSTAAISAYTTSNAVILGIVAGNRAVALFVAAEKVVKASLLALTPVSQTLYPRIHYLMAHSRNDAYALIRRASWFVTCTALVLALVLASMAPWIVSLLFGDGFAEAVPLLQVMALTPLAIALSNLFGLQTMLPLGMKREFSAVLLCAGVLNIALLLLLTRPWAAMGAAVSVVATEIFVAVTMGAWLARCGVPVFGLVRGARA